MGSTRKSAGAGLKSIKRFREHEDEGCRQENGRGIGKDIRKDGKIRMGLEKESDDNRWRTTWKNYLMSYSDDTNNYITFISINRITIR